MIATGYAGTVFYGDRLTLPRQENSRPRKGPVPVCAEDKTRSTRLICARKLELGRAGAVQELGRQSVYEIRGPIRTSVTTQTG